MARRLLYAGCGIAALACLSVVGLWNVSLNASEASAGKKADVVTRLESRIAALESRINALEKERAASGTQGLILQGPHAVLQPGALEYSVQPAPPGAPSEVPGSPKMFNGHWCYTILIDNKGNTVQR